MKNLLAIFFALVMGGTALFAQVAVAAEKKVLVAYFSHTGTTEKVALEIQRQIGGDLFKVETVQNYSTDHKKLVDYAKKELAADARPSLKASVTNLDAYDVVFVGYPIWWYTLPMPLFTFFESHNSSGKTVIPFCTHGGSRLSGTVELIQQLAPKAQVLEGLAISRKATSEIPEDVTEWLKKLKY